jgi:type IV pilus assembly protein PilE
VNNTKLPGIQHQGFSLIEALVAVIIIGILATMAHASYQESVLKSQRKTALASLMEIASKQEDYRVANRRYTDDLTQLGYSAKGDSGTPFYIDNQGNSSTTSSGTYKVVLTRTNSTTYNLTAAPINAQAKDTGCGTLGITSAGAKSATGSQGIQGCWR